MYSAGFTIESSSHVVFDTTFTGDPKTWNGGMAETCSNPKRRMALLESPIFKARRITTNYNT